MVATLGKVTAFVTRDAARGRELLVFRHPTSGVQLPAGTVEEGETFADAVLREVREETGLSDVAIVRQLDVIPQLPPPGQAVLLEPVTLPAAPGAGDLYLTRGIWVWVGEERDGQTLVTYDEVDTSGAEPVLLWRRSGWVSATILTTRVERAFFHLHTTAPTPDRWSLLSDGGRTFYPYWVPLAQDPNLVRGQDEWLARVRARLAGGLGLT